MTRPIHQGSCSSDDHEGFCCRMLTKLNSLWVRLTYPFASCGRNLSLHYASEISRTLATRIQLGSGVSIGRHTWFHLGMEGEHAIKIAIEQDCRIGPRCTISAKNSIHLGRNVVLASDVLLMDHNHAYEDVTTAIWRQGPTPGGRIKIGEGCRIGQGAAILCDKGDLVLGKNCEVAPGAVVTRSFPADSVISGICARREETGHGRSNRACYRQILRSRRRDRSKAWWRDLCPRFAGASGKFSRHRFKQVLGRSDQRRGSFVLDLAACRQNPHHLDGPDVPVLFVRQRSLGALLFCDSPSCRSLHQHWRARRLWPRGEARGKRSFGRASAGYHHGGPQRSSAPLRDFSAKSHSCNARRYIWSFRASYGSWGRFTRRSSSNARRSDGGRDNPD